MRSVRITEVKVAVQVGVQLKTKNRSQYSSWIWTLIFLFSFEVSAFSTKGYWIPRSRTLEFGEIKYDLQVQQGPEKGKPNQNGSSIGVEGGFLDWEKLRIEAGGDWVEPTQDDILYGIVGNVKLSYQDSRTDGWSVTLGAESFPVRPDQHDDNLIYTAVEAQIGSEWIAEIGGFTGQESRIKTSSGVMLGLWRKIQFGAGDVGVEWMSSQGPLGYLVPGFRAQVRDGFEATLAYAFAGDREIYRDLFLTRKTVNF